MALDEFLTALDAGGRMQRQAQAQEAAGEAQRAQQTRQLFDILIDAMEQTYQVLGACVMEPPQFTAMFRMLLHSIRSERSPLRSIRCRSGRWNRSGAFGQSI